MQEQHQEIFMILQKQIEERQQQKKQTMFQLKKQKIQELKADKKKLSDGQAKHNVPFLTTDNSGKLFQKSDFLIPKPQKKTLDRIQSAWLPTSPHSRLISATIPDTEPLPRPPSQKEKLWRPFSSQPQYLKMIQLQPHSPKESARTLKKNSLAFDTGEKLIQLKPFMPTRRIFSAFPK